MVFVEESVNDSVSVDLGICNTGAIGSNDLVVAVMGLRKRLGFVRSGGLGALVATPL